MSARKMQFFNALYSGGPYDGKPILLKLPYSAVMKIRELEKQVAAEKAAARHRSRGWRRHLRKLKAEQRRTE